MQQDRKGGKREKKERRKERKKEKGKKEGEKEKKEKKKEKREIFFLWNCMASSTSRHEKIRPCRAKRSGASRPNFFEKFM